jgi:hypothetical protein
LEVILRGLEAALRETASVDAGLYARPGPASSATTRLLELLTRLDHPVYIFAILLEDLHHASDAVCTLIRDFLRIDQTGRCPLTIVISGRDDYSFPNDAYFALLDVLAHAEVEASSNQEGHVTTVCLETCLPMAPRLY